MIEIWKDIKNYEGFYQVSNLGRVKSLHFNKEKILRYNTKANEYISIILCKHSKHFSTRIHQLVAKTFIKNPNNYLEINHINGNKADNNINNLEWCSRMHNIKHSIENKLTKPTGAKGERNIKAKLTEKEVLEIRMLYKTGKYL